MCEKYRLLTNFNISIQLPSNNRHRWIHPQRLKDNHFQILHAKSIIKGYGTVRVSEDGVELVVYPRLDVLVDAKEAQDEAGASCCGVMALDGKLSGFDYVC